MRAVLRRLFARIRWHTNEAKRAVAPATQRKSCDEKKPTKTRVFLSYSRKDEIFTRRLAEALSGRGYAPDFDQSVRDPSSIDFGISAEDAWWTRLKEMIASA